MKETRVTPPIPLTAAERAEFHGVVAREWTDAATEHGVNARRYGVSYGPHGLLSLCNMDDGCRVVRGWPDGERAVASLCMRLRERYYVVEDGRVVGLAAVEHVTVVPFRPDDGFPICDGYMVGPDDGKSRLWPTRGEAIAAFHRENPGKPLPLVRLRDLDLHDPRREAYDDALFAARQAARPAQAEDAKRVGARRRDGAAYPKGGR